MALKTNCFVYPRLNQIKASVQYVISTAVKEGLHRRLVRVDSFSLHVRSTEETVSYLAASDYNPDESRIIRASSFHRIIKSFCKKGWAI